MGRIPTLVHIMEAVGGDPVGDMDGRITGRASASFTADALAAGSVVVDFVVVDSAVAVSAAAGKVTNRATAGNIRQSAPH
jgi:hypothetical protein